MNHDTPRDPIDKLLDQFLLIKKVVPILQAPRCQGSKVAMFMQDMLRVRHMTTIPPIESSVLRLLDSLNWRTTADPRERQIYSQAIRELHISYSLMIIKQSEWSTIFYWTMQIPLGYIECLHARRHIALLILGCYCILVRHAPARWWMQYWNEQVLEFINRLLGEEWQTMSDLLWTQQDLEHISQVGNGRGNAGGT